jgi:putative addiction module killer protein
MGYFSVVEVRQTDQYRRWFDRLRDRGVRALVLVRIRRLSLGHAGDARSVGGGVWELRLDHGPGYRIYFTRRGGRVVVLLAGGTKQGQKRDIPRAMKLAQAIGDD